ncbi:hypothetical protein [Acetobacter senegalensis]|uniref:hypothetical protein n=1 Tax=Acetobacter senegalensis TaxID=446692 RepID=UPI00264A70A9|nr:hypothetical protein [Acetobacter senegalensis]MDN7355190.1 hypothetical protein [Acetobacter senegalensis]
MAKHAHSVRARACTFICSPIWGNLLALFVPVLAALAIIWLGTPDPVATGHAALALEAVR